ncbi:hypothetical protein J4E93_008016 [Alternaria ventricosa]|uniref:uncharacterized protein n=1 Tax=Alternaria ventricosa TaxID=1187951 RepID=UPI0020C56EC9|nr:uncharacterized protein J4E93_008016 [Alternaria ventricosa]KAI4641138.1 hypothetical protein J4E93_008016 [Alternaria ventricosa]
MERPSSTAVEIATAMFEITLTNTLTSPLLRLPAELRNKIYTYVGHSAQISIAATITNANLGDPTSNPSKFTMQFVLPGLLSTCHQTRSEATALVYAQITIDTFPGDAWYWLYSQSSHQICAHVTSLQISEFFADLMEREVNEREKNSKDTKCCTVHLPRLKRVHVVCQVVAGWPIGGGESMEEAVRKWFGNEGLDVFFEGNWAKQYFSPPHSLIERFDMLVDVE